MQSLIIEIVSTQVEVRNMMSRKNQPLQFNEQRAYLHKPGQPYPQEIKVNLENGQQPYPPGNYDLHPDSFYVDRFNGIAVRPKLIPRPAEQHKQQPKAVNA